MPVLAMAEPVLDHQKRFQAAVDVIHNLPKNGSYRPSYEVMLRFYGLYKQAVCGPCTVARPGFWDPVGRYKWDAWSRLGQMSSESAMAAYVDQMKNVAQEVIDSTPMNEKTASLFHHFEPLYLVIEDMPRPPQALITLTEGVKGSDDDEGLTQREEEEQADSIEESCVPEDPDPELNLFEVIDLSTNTNDSGVCDGVVVTSDSESEIFCDSVDSVEQLSSIKVAVGQSNGFHNGHVTTSSPCPPQQQASGLEGPLEARQVGAGQGGEGADHTKGPRRDRDTGRGGSHNWRERGVPQGGVRRGPPGGGGGGDGRGGADGSENSPDRGQDVRLQQQIILALRRLREDMRSVMDRLEVVERLAATHSQSLEWRPCLQCAASASQQQEEGWWPFEVSGQTVLLFLLWPFVAQGLVSVLRKAAHRRNRIAS